MMITSIDQIVSDMQKPGKRSLVVSDNNEFLVEPFGPQVLRVGTAQGLESVLVELDKAETTKNQSCKVDQRGIECVVIEKQIRTRRMQKMYQLQKLRQQRRVMKISLIEHSDNIANVNGCHDSDLDVVVLNLSHHDFIDQVRRIKQRYCASRTVDLTAKVDHCLANCGIGESGWLIINLSEGICLLEKFDSASSVEADEKTEMQICDALDTACTQTFDECCMELESILVDLENCDITPYENFSEAYICSSCGILLPFDPYTEENNRYENSDENTFQEEELFKEDEEERESSIQEEEESESLTESVSDDNKEPSSESSSDDDEEESETFSADESDESVSADESDESVSTDESDESVSAGESDESVSADESDNDESETSSTEESDDSETIEDEQSADSEKSVDDEVVVVSSVYVNQKSEDELQYEIAMQKIDSLIDQLQKTRAAAKLAKETNKAGWFEWFWASQAKK